MKYSEVIEIIQHGIRTLDSGSDVDKLAKAILGNFLPTELPYHPIPLENSDQLVFMLRNSDKPHMTSDGISFYFVAYYSSIIEYPICRSFYLKIEDMLEAAIITRKITEMEIKLLMVPPPKYETFIEDKDFAERTQKYKMKQDENQKELKGLFEGRKTNGISDECHLFNSKGCFVCGDPITTNTTTIAGQAPGIMIGFKLCANHMQEARQSDSFIHYIGNHFNIEIPFTTTPMENNEHFKIMQEWLPTALDSKIIKSRKTTLTLLRKSGFKIVFRLDDIKNYGYMIINPKNKEIVRFDSADHHKVPYGPDHLHFDLEHPGEVIPSYATGSPLFDIIMVKKMLEEKEAE